MMGINRKQPQPVQPPAPLLVPVQPEWICGGCARPCPTEEAMDACARGDLNALVAAAVVYSDRVRVTRAARERCWSCGARQTPYTPAEPGPGRSDRFDERRADMQDLTSPGTGSNANAPNTSLAHPARIYDYLLGGKDNYAPDRAAADAMIAQLPTIPTMARANRAFLGRAVTKLVTEHRINKFLDIGCGLPTVESVHQVAQALDPTARVVYVDNDPLVLAHSRALLGGTSAGQIEVVCGDARDPHGLLADPVLAATLDDHRPVGVMLTSLLMYFTDAEVEKLLGALAHTMPAGSYLTISHPTADFDPHTVAAAVTAAENAGVTYQPRTRAHIEHLLSDLDLLEPGITPLLDWPTPEAHPDPKSVYYWAAVAQIPLEGTPL